MTLGTKTLLFGVHQVFIHPSMVLVSWLCLYRSFPTWREMICIIIHDWGYWGMTSLKDAKGDTHPEFGANLAMKWFGPTYRDFILGHSSFYIKRNGIKPSKLMAADKYWHCIVPLWFYKCLAVPTGEFAHYREMKHARQVAGQNESDMIWWLNLKKVCLGKILGTYEIDSKNLDKRGSHDQKTYESSK